MEYVGHTYDCKSSKLKQSKNSNSKEWTLPLKNKQIIKIDYIIFGGFNENYTKLLHVWMIPIRTLCFKKDDNFYLKSGISISASNYGIHKWKRYEITDKCLDIDNLLDKLNERKT